MPRDPSGNYSLPPGTLVNTGDTIEVSQHNPAFQDVAQAVTNSLDRDGTGGMRAALNMGGYRATNLAEGTADTDAVTVGQINGRGLPIGTPLPWFMPSAPTGFVLAYGQAISRTGFAELFALFGTTFGIGDGVTTFNVPDCRGAVFIGMDTMGGSPRGLVTAATSLGAIIGEQEHLLTVPELPEHNHGGTTGTAGAHTHTTDYFLATDTGAQAGALVDPTGTRGTPVATSSDGDHQHTIPVQGSGFAHNNVQPSFVVNIIIKALN